jgi:uncharacterized protein (TIGR00369 family)
VTEEGAINDFTVRDPDFAKRIQNSFDAQGVMEHIGALMMSVRPGYCEIELPYSDEVSQQHGFFHGGIISTIADSAAGYAASSLMDAEDGVLTVEYKINFMAPAYGDRALARGQVMRAGRTLTVTRAEVSVFKDGHETVCATMQQTIMRITGRSEIAG